MRFKKFKHVSPFLLSATLLLGVLTGCAVTGDNTNGSTSDSNTGEGNKDLEQFVKSVTVKTQPIKAKYIVGEKIDLKGLTFDTVWSIYGEETAVPDMTYQDLDSYDKTATEGMTAVKCTIGGFTFEVAITVEDVSAMYSSIKFERLDGSESASVIKGVSFFDTYKTTAVGKDGTTDKELSANDGLTFQVKQGDTTKDTTVDDVFAVPGDIDVLVNWHGLTGKLTIKVINGYMVYGKDMIATDDIKPEDKNFLEKDKTSEAMKVAHDAGVDYAGEIRQGYHLIFHVWSDVARTANIVLYVSSTIRTYWAGYPDYTNQWKPTETADQKFNEIFTVTYGKDSTAITVSDDVVLPGSESTIKDAKDCPTSFKTPDDKGRYYDDKIWVNWKAVEFGTIPLQVGDNVITLTNIKGNVANVYGLEAQFAD